MIRPACPSSGLLTPAVSCEFASCPQYQPTPIPSVRRRPAVETAGPHCQRWATPTSTRTSTVTARRCQLVARDEDWATANGSSLTTSGTSCEVVGC